MMAATQCHITRIETFKVAGPPGQQNKAGWIRQKFQLYRLVDFVSDRLEIDLEIAIIFCALIMLWNV